MNWNEMTVIKQYELGYLTLETFMELLLGCGQRTIAEEGFDRFCFYIEKEAGRNPYDYYITTYKNMF